MRVYPREFTILAVLFLAVEGTCFQNSQSDEEVGICCDICLQVLEGPCNMGVSENSVPLNPMVNDHYPYEMAISLGIYPTFSDKPT